MKVSDFIAMFDQVKVSSWSMSDEKVNWLDGNNAIVTYKWTGAGTVPGAADARHRLRLDGVDEEG